VPAAGDSVWGAYPFARLGGGVCGGVGMSPLKLTPLDLDGAPTGDASLLLAR
jgi:hypothetical protein